jgi:hypothetical protein
MLRHTPVKSLITEPLRRQQRNIDRLHRREYAVTRHTRSDRAERILEYLLEHADLISSAPILDEFGFEARRPRSRPLLRLRIGLRDLAGCRPPNGFDSPSRRVFAMAEARVARGEVHQCDIEPR